MNVFAAIGYLAVFSFAGYGLWKFLELDIEEMRRWLNEPVRR